MKRVGIPLLVLSISLFFSCKKDDSVVAEAKVEVSQVSSDQLRTEFAKALAKAVAEPVVRALIKEEALKKFDNDYDFLYSLVKDRSLSPYESFETLLLKNSSYPALLSEAKEQLPLLTILVPELKTFSADKWDVQKEIPLVAILANDHDEKARTRIQAFDANGNVFELSSKKDPGRPVIVIKDNERVVAVENSNTRYAQSGRDNYIFSNSKSSFYFKGDQFNRKRSLEIENAYIALPSIIDDRLEEAFSLNAASQRDYVYYNILNPTDQGALNNNYAEFITGFNVNDKASLDYVFEDPTSDWADGALEFQVDVLFFNGTSALSKVTKVFGVPRSAIYQTNTNGDSVVFQYTFPTPIPIVTWDMKQQGDTWKYVVNEIDPGSVITTTQTSTTKFGTNFSLVGQIFEKIGINFGTSTETTSTNTVTIQATVGSDFCGEGVVKFIDPILLFRWTVGPPSSRPYQANDVNTGTISMLIAPRHL